MEVNIVQSIVVDGSQIIKNVGLYYIVVSDYAVSTVYIYTSVFAVNKLLYKLSQPSMYVCMY